MGRLSLSKAWEETAAILVREGGLLAAVALALVVLPQVVLAVVGIPIGAQATALAELIYIAAILLGFVAQIAINRLGVGPSITVSEAIVRGFMRVASVFAVLVVLAFAVSIIAIAAAIPLSAAGIMSLPRQGQALTPGLAVLFIILVVLVFAIFQLIFPVAAIETGNPIRLISRSWQLGRRQFPRLLVFVMVVFVGIAALAVASQYALGSVIVLLLGRPNPGTIAALVLGLIVGVIQAAFTVTTAVMLARIYVQLSARPDAQASVPSSGI
jgi:hypothetical protein